MAEGTDSAGRPDPTIRTLESMFREVKSVEDKLNLRFDTVAVKFQGYDEAVKVLQAFTNKQPTTEAVYGDAKALKELTETNFRANERLSCEKFKGVQDRFKELDLRYDQLDGSNKEAINAALRAAEKAVEKTEANFTKQIDGLVSLNASTKSGLEGTISDLKDRITIMEAGGKGRSAGVAMIGAIIVGAASVIVATIVVVNFMLAKGG